MFECQKFAIFTASMLLLMASPAFTQDQPVDDQQASSNEDSSELVCTMEREVGSRISRRVCRTQSQIERDREDAVEFIDNANSREAQIYLPPQ